MSTVIITLLTLIEGLLPSIGVNAKVVDQILSSLIAIIPVLADQAAEVLAPVRNIITALQTSGPLTSDQLAQLDTLNAQIDAAFEAAAKADGVPDDPAPAPAPAPAPVTLTPAQDPPLPLDDPDRNEAAGGA